jgi:hypothetical protein
LFQVSYRNSGKVVLLRNNKKIEIREKFTCFGLSLTSWHGRAAFTAYSALDTELCTVTKETFMREVAEKPGFLIRFYETAAKVKIFLRRRAHLF